MSLEFLLWLLSSSNRESICESATLVSRSTGSVVNRPYSTYLAEELIEGGPEYFL